MRRKEIINGRLVCIRFFVGISIFLIPALVCTFIPLNWALKINPVAFINTYKVAVIAAGDIPVGEIFGEKNIVQTFKPKLNGLAVVSVQLATYARPNDGEIKLRLEDKEGNKLAEKIVNAKSISDNLYSNFRFEPIQDSMGKTYRLVIQAEKSYPGNAITAWASKTNVYHDGDLSFAGRPTGGDLAMKIYFDPHVSSSDVIYF